MTNIEKDKLEMLLRFYEYVLHRRDPYEDGHGRRVAILALQLARKMEYPPGFLMQLYYAARLHDVGKLKLPVDLLNKQILTKYEIDEVRGHVMEGFLLFQKLGINGLMLRTIAESHENYDGTGYPMNKAGTDIYDGARIVRICDTYDALTSTRPYGKRLLQAETIAEMETCAAWYDPIMLKAFREMMI